MSETDLVRACQDLIRLKGGVPIRVNAGVQVIPGHPGADGKPGKDRVFRGAKPGTSDIIVLYCGRYLALECKVGRNQPTPTQEAFLQTVTACGGIAAVIRSVDYLETILDTIPILSNGGLRYDEQPSKS